jgi:Sulfotransferase domain
MKPEDLPQHLIKTLLPRNTRRKVNRWYKFRTADYILVSYPKCGRTWLRVMLSNYYVERYGLAHDALLDFANLHLQNREIPRIFPSNDIPHTLIPPEAISADKSAYYDRKVIYLTRDPRDVVVSMFFQRTRRDTNYTGTLREFIFAREGGIDTMIRFYNVWADSFPKIKNLLVIRYEDMKADPERTLTGLLQFLGHAPDREIVHNAVEAASFDRMKNMERDNAFDRSWLKAGNVNDEESFKVRRGKIGGYADYLDKEDIEKLNRLIETRLSQVFGY